MINSIMTRAICMSRDKSQNQTPEIAANNFVAMNFVVMAYLGDKVRPILRLKLS